MKISRSKTMEPEPVTIVATGTTISGKIESNQTVRIDGHFKGDIHVNGLLITSPSSHITGDVIADEIIVGGKIKGELTGRNSITIQPTGIVEGTLKTDSVIIEKGGLFEGDCLMHRKEAELIEMGPKLLEKQA